MQDYIGSQSGAGNSQKLSTREGEMVIIQKRIRECTSRVQTLNSEISRIVDHVFGDIAETNCGNATECPSGIIGEIAASLSMLGEEISRAEASLKRLSAL